MLIISKQLTRIYTINKLVNTQNFQTLLLTYKLPVSFLQTQLHFFSVVITSVHPTATIRNAGSTAEGKLMKQNQNCHKQQTMAEKLMKQARHKQQNVDDSTILVMKSPYNCVFVF